MAAPKARSIRAAAGGTLRQLFGRWAVVVLDQRAHLVVSGLDEVGGIRNASVLGQGLASREDSAAREPLGPKIAEEPPLVAQPVHGTRFGEKLVEGATMGLRHAVPRLSGAPREHVSRRSNVYPFHGAANRAEQNLRHLQYVGLADVLAVDGTVADESEVGRERRADFTGQFAQGRENVAGRIGGGD